jgi:hypothetical protein
MMMQIILSFITRVTTGMQLAGYVEVEASKEINTISYYCWY